MELTNKQREELSSIRTALRRHEWPTSLLQRQAMLLSNFIVSIKTGDFSQSLKFGVAEYSLNREGVYVSDVRYSSYRYMDLHDKSLSNNLEYLRKQLVSVTSAEDKAIRLALRRLRKYLVEIFPDMYPGVFNMNYFCISRTVFYNITSNILRALHRKYTEADRRRATGLRSYRHKGKRQIEVPACFKDYLDGTLGGSIDNPDWIFSDSLVLVGILPFNQSETFTLDI